MPKVGTVVAYLLFTLDGVSFDECFANKLGTPFFYIVRRLKKVFHRYIFMSRVETERREERESLARGATPFVSTCVQCYTQGHKPVSMNVLIPGRDHDEEEEEEKHELITQHTSTEERMPLWKAIKLLLRVQRSNIRTRRRDSSGNNKWICFLF